MINSKILLSITFLVALFALAPLAAAETEAGRLLTVTDIVVDKTDKNAVVARDLAMVEARRIAFRALAEKSMPADAFKSFQPPDDQTIMTLVQDFEIRNEQISANRYVASFTVRFNSTLLNYINVPPEISMLKAAPPPAPDAPSSAPPPTPPAQAAPPSAPETTATPPEPSTGLRDVLVLPYLEDISGKKLLWEDPNPWREAWQEAGNSSPAPNLTITVPLGDIADLSCGSAESVWTGDYSTLDKLLLNYAAGEAVLAVASKSGIYMRVDLYIYKNGRLERKKPVIPYMSSEDSKEAFKGALAQVVQALRAPEPFPQAGGGEEPAPLKPLPAPAPEKSVGELASPQEKTALDAAVSFSSFSQWLEIQRRLSQVSPGVQVDISSLSRNDARFTLTFDGSLDALKNALADKGLALNRPVVEVEESIPGDSRPTVRPVYELRLLN